MNSYENIVKNTGNKMVDAIFKDIANLSLEEMLKLNSLLVTLINDSRRVSNFVAKSNFAVGDSIKCTIKKLERTGTIKELRKTKALVKLDLSYGLNGDKWLIPYSNLTKFNRLFVEKENREISKPQRSLIVHT